MVNAVGLCFIEWLNAVLLLITKTQTFSNWNKYEIKYKEKCYFKALQIIKQIQFSKSWSNVIKTRTETKIKL